MDFWFDINMIRKHGFACYRKSKLLAKAIEKANKPDGCCHRSQYWLKVAEKLAADENIPTDYVPVRMMILSLHNGYINLVLDLYGQPELTPSKDLQKRAKNLVQDLLMIHAGKLIKLELIEKANHLIDIITALYIIRFANLGEGGEKLMKKYLAFQALNNLGLANQNAEIIDNMIDKIAKIKLDSPQSVQNGLPNLMRVIPIQNIGAKYEKYTKSLLGAKKLLTKYPFDYVEKKSGEIDIWKVMGLKNHKMISEYKEERELVHSQVLTEKPLNNHHIELIYEKVLELKTRGVGPNLVALKLQIEGIYISGKDIIDIYNIISKQCPNPRVLHAQPIEDLGFQTAPLPYIKPATPKKKASPKNFKDSPKNDSSPKTHDSSPKDKMSIKFQNDSPKYDPSPRQIHTYPKDKSSPKYQDSSPTHKPSPKHHNTSSKNKSIIQIHPVDETYDYHTYESRGEDQTYFILGANHDTQKDFPSS